MGTQALRIIRTSETTSLQERITKWSPKTNGASSIRITRDRIRSQFIQWGVSTRRWVWASAPSQILFTINSKCLSWSEALGAPHLIPHSCSSARRRPGKNSSNGWLRSSIITLNCSCQTSSSRIFRHVQSPSNSGQLPPTNFAISKIIRIPQARSPSGVTVWRPSSTTPSTRWSAGGNLPSIGMKMMIECCSSSR